MKWIVGSFAHETRGKAVRNAEFGLRKSPHPTPRRSRAKAERKAEPGYTTPYPKAFSRRDAEAQRKEEPGQHTRKQQRTELWANGDGTGARISSSGNCQVANIDFLFISIAT